MAGIGAGTLGDGQVFISQTIKSDYIRPVLEIRDDISFCQVLVAVAGPDDESVCPTATGQVIGTRTAIDYIFTTGTIKLVITTSAIKLIIRIAPPIIAELFWIMTIQDIVAAITINRVGTIAGAHSTVNGIRISITLYCFSCYTAY